MKIRIAIYLTFIILFFRIAISCSPKSEPEVVEKTPVSIPTFTPITSTVPLSTLTTQEKIDQVANLQIENSDCVLPCWWGIIPGVTSWDDINEKLVPLAVENLSFDVGNGVIIHYLEFPLRSHNIFTNIFVQKSGIVDVIRMGWDESLLDFLHTHGSPTEIWVSSDGKVPMGNSAFRIAFFYPEKGLMITYFGDAKPISQNNVDYLMVCGSDFSSRAGIWLWNPNSKKQFDELPIENLTGVPPAVSKLKRVGEYTNFDDISFYNSVVQNPDKACLETPADIWPNPDYFITPTP